MSFTATLFPIIAALSAPEGSYFKINNSWSTVNEKQAYFIEHFFQRKSELSRFDDKELKSWVSKDADYLNRIAREHGFSIELKSFLPDSFGSLSILDVFVQWIEKAQVSMIVHNDETYKAVRLKNHFTVFETNAYAYPIAKIETQNQDVVYITPTDQPAQEFVLLQKVSELQAVIATAEQAHYDSIVFPQVELDHKVNISWLLGMWCYGEADQWIIAQALQQTKFKLDENGAHVKSAAAVEFQTCIAFPKTFVINQPFYIWIERPGCSIPVFAGCIDPIDWIKKV